MALSPGEYVFEHDEQPTCDAMLTINIDEVLPPSG